MKLFNVEPRRSIIILFLLILLKVVIQAALYKQGFISVSADEFSRGIRAARWALNPQIDLLNDFQDAWLPFEKYLNGALLVFWPDVIIAPRATVFIASCLFLISHFILVYKIFDNFHIANLACLYTVFQPWYVWLSSTPMLEMYYLSLFFCGNVFLIIWLKQSRPGYWFLAGTCFALASGFHVQSWIQINAVILLTLPKLISYFNSRKFKLLCRLLCFYGLSNLLIISKISQDFLKVGYINFPYLTKHIDYSRWYYHGYVGSISDKFFYYPTLLVEQSSILVWPLLIISIFFLWHDREVKLKYIPLALLLLVLFFFSIMNIFSVPATAAPGRYSVFYSILLSSYVAYACHRLALCNKVFGFSTGKYTSGLLSVILFACLLCWGFSRIKNFPREISPEAIEAGNYLKKISESGKVYNDNTYLVELKFWDFRAIQLTSGQYDSIVFDREFNLRDRNKPSLFESSTENIYTDLISLKVRYVILHDSKLKLKASKINFLRLDKQIGRWSIFEFNQ